MLTRICRPALLSGYGQALALTTVVILTAACSDVNATLPAGTPNPSVFNNAAGAIMKRNAADSIFESALVRYVVDAGLITDELEDPRTGVSVYLPSGTSGSLDERILPEVNILNEAPLGSKSYELLQQTRGYTREAIGALATYDSAASPALRGQMYALNGYAEIMLAELFCSGIPLSTYDYNGNFTYKPGSTQQQVYQDAIAKLDTAFALSSDSVNIQNLARVGLGRAYLDLGDYTSAAQAVADVPNDFRYQVHIQWYVLAGVHNILNTYANISDQEGQNGLPFLSSGDPRTKAVPSVISDNGIQLYFPEKYGAGIDSSAHYYNSIPLADGIEAQLIRAEAALKAGDPNWLTILNTLRTSGGVTVDTIADTLGVTNCGGVCGYDPGNGLGGSTPEFGQPYPGGFVTPSGFTVAGADTTYPAPAGVQSYCYNYSWYVPCYQGDSMVVYYYTRPKTNPIWSAGTGGVGGLPPLSDPGTSVDDTARVNLLFRERAYWLYVTGHRQGDLRRLVRNYHRDETQVYPTGPYLAPGQGVYGDAVNAPVPSSETPNPYFHGCIDRKA